MVVTASKREITACNRRISIRIDPQMKIGHGNKGGIFFLENGVIGMYGPPPRRKRKVRIAGTVCAYVYGLVGVFNDPGPGWNALRSVPVGLQRPLPIAG